MEDFHDTQTLGNERVIHEGTNPVVIRRKDPFGFWSIHYRRGPVPEGLKGDYTTPWKAREAFEHYLTLNPDRK